ncbi:MAG: ATP-binding cassette domain-containing protein [Gammaproteobacteria bacterium]|nr:ATP-binding cassette domain-containing protein [Gammaproteobacteria bacterium]
MPEVTALQVHSLSRHFGGVAAVDGVDLEVRRGEALGVIGPNGAGKSTFINLISGALAPSGGRIALFGEDITALNAEERCRRGIGRTHQIPRPFSRMSVRENLALAARHARDAGDAVAVRERCQRILERTGLADVAERLAGSLPLLRRKRLELARALALQPRLLLLDEIGAGLIDSETRALITLVNSIRAEVEAIVLIEHVMDVITACCERTAVLSSGRLLLAGETRTVLADAEVAAVYLGTSDTGPAREAATGPAADAARPVATPSPARAGAAASRPLLAVRAATVNYGGVRALRGVDLDVGAGEAVALLGANGAGKTTLARAISGAVPLTAGTVHFDGAALAGLAPERITALGIGHCMEGRRIFSSLSVEENLLLAVPPAARAAAAARLAAVYAEFPALNAQRHKPGTAMSGGQQQMLAIGRALMSGPRLLILDEVSLGLAPIAVGQLYEALARIRATGVAMLIVEQNIHRGLQLADYACVLAHGELRLAGRAADIRGSRALRELYVGEDTATPGD